LLINPYYKAAATALSV